MVQYDTLRYFMILYVAVRMVRCDIVQYDSLRYGAVQYVFLYNMVLYIQLYCQFKLKLMHFLGSSVNFTHTYSSSY